MSELNTGGSKPSMMTDAVITPLASAEQLVRDYCGWHVAPVYTETIRVDGSGTRTIFLPTLKVRDILDVNVGGYQLDVNSLEWSEGGILYHPNGVWPKRARSVVVTLTHGFDPSDVAWIVKQIADRVSGGQPAGIERVTVGQRSVTYRPDAGIVGLLQTEKDALHPYKIERKAF